MILEFETTVKNGLPVIVETDFKPGQPPSFAEPGDSGYCDIICFRFKSGHELEYFATLAEHERIWEEATILWWSEDYD